MACYELLEHLAPSALHTLNRALAMAEWRGPAAGLAMLQALTPPPWLADSFMWAAVLSDLPRRCGNRETARGYLETALASAPSEPVREALKERSSFSSVHAG